MVNWSLKQFCFALIVLLIDDFSVNTILGQKHSMTKNATSIDCSMNLNSFRKTHQIHNQRFRVRCSLCKPGPCYIYGTSFYTPRTSICCAAIHDGRVTQLKDNHNTVCVKTTNNNGQTNGFQDVPKDPVQTATSTSSMSTAVIADNDFSNPVTRLSNSTSSMSTSFIAENDLSNPVTRLNNSKSAISSFPSHPQKSEDAAVTDPLVTIEPTELLTGKKVNLNEHSTEITAVNCNTASGTQASRIRDDMTIYDTTVFQVFVSLFVLLLCIGLVLFIYRCRMSNWSWRIRRRSRLQTEEACVCYVNASSRQGLLNDPETCDRPCSLKTDKQLCVMEKTENEWPSCSSTRIETDCADCDEKCHTSKYEF